MKVKKGLVLESNNGEKWEIIEINKEKITIRQYCGGDTVGTIAGITLEDITKYFKT